ncbi:hypothetical protein [Nocardiopsis ganjiahuensis]|uniref:hypothetical protein n=1 Tax=Nocardiopsis ganjiahuensis TaxID=239984 RepID=UPI0018725A79|nr:hypothetical protein [Nocardiopsis ganjiahuensis]
MSRLAALVPRTLGNRGFRLLMGGRSAGDLGSEMVPVAMVGLVLVEHGPLMLGLRDSPG